MPYLLKYRTAYTNKGDPIINAQKQLTNIIVPFTAYLRNKKRALNLEKFLTAMILAVGHTITSWLKSGIVPTPASTFYYNVAAILSQT